MACNVDFDRDSDRECDPPQVHDMDEYFPGSVGDADAAAAAAAAAAAGVEMDREAELACAGLEVGMED